MSDLDLVGNRKRWSQRQWQVWPQIIPSGEHWFSSWFSDSLCGKRNRVAISRTRDKMVAKWQNFIAASWLMYHLLRYFGHQWQQYQEKDDKCDYLTLDLTDKYKMQVNISSLCLLPATCIEGRSITRLDRFRQSEDKRSQEFWWGSRKSKRWYWSCLEKFANWWYRSST